MPAFTTMSTQDNELVASTSSSSVPEATLEFPRLTRAAVDACAFKSWYSKYRRITPKATILDLEEGFVDYLKADGLFLPDDNESDDASEDPNGEEAGTDEEDEDEVQRPQYDFSKLSPRLQQVIDEYGAVFPKLNWSSPQDAVFMCAGPPLKCVNPNEVYLLLKSSDFITHDLDFPYEGCEDVEETAPLSPTYHLVLKKWFDMPRSHEFRCFVRQRQLTGVSQRDNNFYDFLQSSSRQRLFVDKIQDLFEKHIKESFPSADYAFDVYLTRDESKAFLIDFNPFAPTTDSLLFDWEELIPGIPLIPFFRVIGSETQASQAMPAFSHNRYPREVVGMSDGASIAEFAQKWREALADATLGTPSESASSPSVQEPTGR